MFTLAIRGVNILGWKHLISVRHSPSFAIPQLSPTGKSSIFLIFPHNSIIFTYFSSTFLNFVLILALRVGESREDPCYGTPLPWIYTSMEVGETHVDFLKLGSHLWQKWKVFLAVPFLVSMVYAAGRKTPPPPPSADVYQKQHFFFFFFLNTFFHVFLNSNQID